TGSGVDAGGGERGRERQLEAGAGAGCGTVREAGAGTGSGVDAGGGGRGRERQPEAWTGTGRGAAREAAGTEPGSGPERLPATRTDGAYPPCGPEREFLAACASAERARGLREAAREARLRTQRRLIALLAGLLLSVAALAAVVVPLAAR
ncbi:hypothetical protein ACSNOK_31155, partial [Streptomyces sp. URMC 126]